MLLCDVTNISFIRCGDEEFERLVSGSSEYF